jgi:hypothetical protein
VATVRCPFCLDDIVPVPVESDEGEAPTTVYDCPSCRRRLPVETVEEYALAEEEELPS